MNYKCEYCDYISNRMYNIERHHINKHKTLDLNIETIAEGTTEKIRTNVTEEETYKCQKCCKIYKTRKYLLNHEKTCIGITTLTCQKCMTIFSSRFSKAVHIKRDKCKAKSIITLANDYTKHEQDNKISIIGDNNNVVIYNIIINNYGNERKDYITFDEMIKILNSKNVNIIPKYIKLKHFNKEFPENHNIKYEKSRGCAIKKDNEWLYTNLDIFTDNIINDNRIELQRYYNNEKNNIGNALKDIYLMDYIYENLFYLDLSINKKVFRDVRTKIKYIIKYNTLY